MIKPSKLKKGDKIGIIAPSEPISVLPSERREKGFSFLKDKGFEVVKSGQLKTKTGHTAGTIKQRTEAIHRFFRNDKIKCIMAFWGGYNSNQLLEELDYNLIKNNPKIFIGYSDISVLTAAISKKANMVTFMGPGVISFTKPEPFEYTWNYFKKMCIEAGDFIKIDPSEKFAEDAFYLREDDDHRIFQENEGMKIFQKGVTSGRIVAGNLQSLLALLGTSYFPEIEDKILFLEEDGEASVGKIDRFLTHCRQVGVFEKINGLIFGRFMSQSGFDKEDSLKALLKRIFRKYSFPIIYNVDFGHTDPLITIPNGGTSYINTNRKEIIFKQAVANL